MGYYAKRFFNKKSINRNGLLIEYLMNGNTLDTSGNNYNATPTGITYVPNRKGVLTSAAEFIENTDSILMGYSGTLSSYTTSWTVNVWVYTTAWATTLNAITVLKGGSAPLILIIGSNVGYLGLGFGFGIGNPAKTANAKTNTPTSFFLNNWVMCTLSYNGLGEGNINNYNLYENGVLKTKVANSAFGNYTNSNTIGKVPSNTTFTHKGYIDDFRYYTRELTQSEITALYNE